MGIAVFTQIPCVVQVVRHYSAPMTQFLSAIYTRGWRLCRSTYFYAEGAHDLFPMPSGIAVLVWNRVSQFQRAVPCLFKK